MPTISGLTAMQTRAANTVMARAFFPRAKKWLYPKLAGTITATSLVEPFSLLGAAPALSRFNGQLKAGLIPSYSMQVPNPLYKNLIKVDQTDMEGDQTGTLAQLAQGIGVRLAEFPDQLFAARLLNASDPAKVTDTFKGVSYTTTFDGKPFFATNHDTAQGGVQSNILQGTLPSTIEGILANDVKTTALQLQRDVSRVISAIRSVKDTAGIPLYPNILAKENIIVVIPPVLEQAATLAFQTGGANAVIDQTTNVTPLFIKDVLTNGYLAGFVDPEAEWGTVSPVNETDYYVFITDDYVKPFYMQLFQQTISDRPPEGTPDPVAGIVSAVGGATVGQATLFASTRVDTTFNKVGENSDAHTIQTEEFLMSARYRGNMVYGPWFTGWRVKPVNGDNYTGSSSSSSSSST